MNPRLLALSVTTCLLSLPASLAHAQQAYDQTFTNTSQVVTGTSALAAVNFHTLATLGTDRRDGTMSGSVLGIDFDDFDVKDRGARPAGGDVNGDGIVDDPVVQTLVNNTPGAVLTWTFTGNAFHHGERWTNVSTGTLGGVDNGAAVSLMEEIINVGSYPDVDLDFAGLPANQDIHVQLFGGGAGNPWKGDLTVASNGTYMGEWSTVARTNQTHIASTYGYDGSTDATSTCTSNCVRARSITGPASRGS